MYMGIEEFCDYDLESGEIRYKDEFDFEGMLNSNVDLSREISLKIGNQDIKTLLKNIQFEGERIPSFENSLKDLLKSAREYNMQFSDHVRELKKEHFKMQLMKTFKTFEQLSSEDRERINYQFVEDTHNDVIFNQFLVNLREGVNELESPLKKEYDWMNTNWIGVRSGVEVP